MDRRGTGLRAFAQTNTSFFLDLTGTLFCNPQRIYLNEVRTKNLFATVSRIRNNFRFTYGFLLQSIKSTKDI